MEEEKKIEKQIDFIQTTNPTNIHCDKCKLLLLRGNVGRYVKEAEGIELPLTRVNAKDVEILKESGVARTELLYEFYLIDDMYKFENIGISKPWKKDIKFLLCPDCHYGPIGYWPPSNQLDPSKSHFFLVKSRIEEK
ncbi:hypothetical protein SNEBB_005159 [Seison nebaliae]|nr:hypothetical protein SNEBB_005159 [Seison nebaliae]